MKTIKQLVSIGNSWRHTEDARYFRLLESVGAVNVRLFKMSRVVYEAEAVEAGFYSMPVDGFDAFEVITNGDPQIVKVAVSDGAGGYDRYTGTVNLATAGGVVNTGPVNVATSATLLVTANGARKGLRFLNTGGTVVFLGGAGVDLINGVVKLNPGDLLFEADAPAAAWYAVSDGGAGVVKVQELI